MQDFNSKRFLCGLVLSLFVWMPAQASVVIQEVLYDGPGTDPDDAFTELFGVPGTLLDGWSLVGVNGTSGDVYRTIDLSGSIIPMDGVFVVATNSAHAALSAVRDLIENVDWQNGPDALQLLNGGNLIDALQYGDAGVFNAGEGDYAADVTGSMSLSRDGLGTDTDNNAIDFTAGMPTPGVGPSVVPIPAAVWLFASGLGLLGFVRRRA